MCAECERFGSSRAITTKSQFDELRACLYFKGIRPGRLEVVAGSLQGADMIDCLLRCATCGQRFELSCETYHGTGGRFERVMN